jgi:uncharacterized protein with PIN domain
VEGYTDSVKFLVDQPLGGLAKWLRLCGFDAAVVRLAPDQPKRWPPPQPQTHLLTRQSSCGSCSRPDLLILEAAEPAAQLEEVFQRLHIQPRHLKPLSRCSNCNTLLVPLDRDLVQNRVPEHVFHSHRQFSECPRCHRIYWPGSHLRGICKTVWGKLAKPAAEA